MLINEIISDTDPALYDLLLRLHKGATATFNAKKTIQVLNLFPGWTVVPVTLLKPSNEANELRNISVGEDTKAANGIPTWKQHLHASAMSDAETGKSIPRLQVQSFSQDEAVALHAKVAELVVAALPDPKKAKSDAYYVMNLSEPVFGTVHDRQVWVWSFDLYRKCKGYTITAPDGQSFDVAGPVQVLGYAGTTDFAAFFNWALANTNLEEAVNAKLGLAKHVKASERPRIPVGGQTIGTCAICSRAQVVRLGDRGNLRAWAMVNHGYQRPGHGYIIGECFGTGRDPYETSAKACVEYVPHLEAAKTTYERRLADLRSGKVTEFRDTKRNYRTNRDEIIVIKQGEPKFDSLLKYEITNVEQQIKYVTADIVEMRRRITDWKPGTLSRNERE